MREDGTKVSLRRDHVGAQTAANMLEHRYGSTVLNSREPGQMRSDREEVPAPFTKEDADRAEIAEARLRTSRSAVACQVYWPSWFNVCGEIRDKYNSLGGPGSFLSYPSSGNIVNPGNTGERVTFLNGPIYWSAAGGAHPVVNSFLNRWGIHGYEGSYLKYPTTDEIVVPDGGRRQEFQDGAIYVSFQNAIGSAIQNGPLRDKYNSVGGLTPGSSFLGYLTEDHKRTLPDGQGQMARFQNGVIYWHPSHGAHTVSGNILHNWAYLGYESGSFGYPISDDYAFNGGRGQDFQNGRIDGYLTDLEVPAGRVPMPIYPPSDKCDTAVDHPHASVQNANQIHVNVRAYCYNLPGLPTIELEAELSHLRWGGFWIYKPNINKATGEEEDFHLGPEVTQSLNGTVAVWCDRGSYFKYAIDASGTMQWNGEEYTATATYETPEEVQCYRDHWPS
ncbi:LGFP repeat-containing protein [Rhodococcoides corynebacterioides]|uniref:LGFP repeat-containing protein n=1 Tax=Rhodococcoides corynebacterioides TaxID=53972 RepID=UPI0027E1E5B7|nr:hypothetical protein [Rhodococcus corynebacterioides]